MENETSFFEPLIKKAEAYGITTYQLFQLKASEKVVEVLSTVISRGTAMLILLTFVVFISIGISLWLGDLLGKTYYGFFGVAGFYAVIFCGLYFFFHKWTKKTVGNFIVKQMFN